MLDKIINLLPSGQCDKKLRCLIVDDNPALTEVWRAFLLPDKLEIAVSTTSRGARELIHDKTCYDLLILDWRLDRENGGSVLNEWMTVSPGPVIVVSGQLDSELKEDIYIQGASHVLEKPVSYQLLRRVVDWSKEWVQYRRCAQRVAALERLVYVLIVLFAMAEGPRAISLLGEALV